MSGRYEIVRAEANDHTEWQVYDHKTRQAITGPIDRDEAEEVYEAHCREEQKVLLSVGPLEMGQETIVELSPTMVFAVKRLKI